MVALSASKLVCSAMSVINATTSPILLAASASPRTLTLVCSAWRTALEAICDDWLTWREISEMELDSSSAADATVWTLADACSEAAATAAD